MAAENWVFWLNMTNLALGIVTVLAILVVVGAVGWELLDRWVEKIPVTDNLDANLWTMFRDDPHTLSVPGLGFTMADGGEKIKPSEEQSSEEKPSRK
jgi:hypothetical protein